MSSWLPKVLQEAGYAEKAAELTPEEYVQMVKDGEIRDNVLSFQLREGFVVRVARGQAATKGTSKWTVGTVDHSSAVGASFRKSTWPLAA